MASIARSDTPAGTTPRHANPTARAPARTAAVPGPVSGTRVTEAYARMVARVAYFWAWPMVNIYTRRLALTHVHERAVMADVLPIAPLNQLAMLHDFAPAEQRLVTCPDEDLVHGAGIAALDRSPVVVQVPEFGRRFWTYQALDLRTDSFADLGAMHGTPAGFYLVVGPGWDGPTPRGIAAVLRCPTNTAMIVPRVFQEDSADDRQAVQRLLAMVDMYPLAEYDGHVKRHDWRRLPRINPPVRDDGAGEARWVFPGTFFDELPAVLADAPPLPGEETRYAEILALIAAGRRDPAIRKVLAEEAESTERRLIEPLVEFRSSGTPLPHHWTTESNGAAFGSDYFTRTAIARSHILVDRPLESKSFYQDLDASGERLDGSACYTITIPEGEIPVWGFWSLTLYDRSHFFFPNRFRRHSVGTRNRELQVDADGSLTIWVQPNEPSDPDRRSNWLPSPAGEPFSLFLRAYWPGAPSLDGTWSPPPVVRRRGP